MNNYELTLILNPDLSTKFDDFQTKFEKTLADINFTINKLENIGRRQLAYSILNHNKGHYAIFQIEGPSESALELESKLKYDTSVIRHLLLKVDSPSLEDSLLLIESREAKKAPQEEEQSQEKPKVTLAKQNQAAETVAKDESKDGE
jgi:small subunit ribosomal protein S6